MHQQDNDQTSTFPTTFTDMGGKSMIQILKLQIKIHQTKIRSKDVETYII